jgi:hypothetical protein
MSSTPTTVEKPPSSERSSLPTNDVEGSVGRTDEEHQSNTEVNSSDDTPPREIHGVVVCTNFSATLKLIRKIDICFSGSLLYLLLCQAFSSMR